MEGNPTGAMGLADYLGWEWRSKAGLPIVNVPGCPVQPDNFMETVLYLLYQVAGLAPMIPLDDQLRPTWLFGKTVHEGCDRAGYYEQGDFRRSIRLTKVHREIGVLGSGRELQCTQTRLDGGNRRLSQRRRHLHRLHDARLPR
jgi:hydrogenase small subunit